MIRKQIFAELMKTLQRLNWQEQAVQTLYPKVMAVLEDAMQCKEEVNGKSWIRWWVEDNQFGQKGRTVSIPGHEELVETPEELYDFIIFKNALQKK